MNRIQPDTTLPKTPLISRLRGNLLFTIANVIELTILENTTADTNITVNKYGTGRYYINTFIPGIFIANKTIITPTISDWSSIPLSKTTWGDYNYHFTRDTTQNISIFCQKTSDGTYHDFTDIFDPINVPFTIEIYNY